MNASHAISRRTASTAARIFAAAALGTFLLSFFLPAIGFNNRRPPLSGFAAAGLALLMLSGLPAFLANPSIVTGCVLLACKRWKGATIAAILALLFASATLLEYKPGTPLRKEGNAHTLGDPIVITRLLSGFYCWVGSAVILLAGAMVVAALSARPSETLEDDPLTRSAPRWADAVLPAIRWTLGAALVGCLFGLFAAAQQFMPETIQLPIIGLFVLAPVVSGLYGRSWRVGLLVALFDIPVLLGVGVFSDWLSFTDSARYRPAVTSVVAVAIAGYVLWIVVSALRKDRNSK